MRVPGNERAFTVSPTRGIPFPQLVCIGETDGQSQAFPVSAWARPAAALLELARAPPRATVRSPGRDSVAAPTAPAPAPTPTPHTHAQGSMFARSQVQVQTPRLAATSAAALALGGFVGRSGAAGGHSPGDPETGIERPVGLGDRELRREKPWAWRSAGGRRPVCPGHIAATARLPGPGLASGSGPQAALHCSPWAKAPGPGRTEWESAARGPEG